MRIEVLDPKISSLIAAGEVIERPVSVIKELIENSIDSGATRINIETVSGGLDQIKISDNGSGINSEDSPLVFERFATSKVRNKDDLMHISTLGFRGEALFSIAAVSEIEMITKTISDKLATQIFVDQGKINSISYTASVVGTMICVSNLFKNFPARKKFMKTPRSEAGKITSLVQQFILSHPGISFELIQNNSKKFFSVGNGDLRDAVSSVYGDETSSEMLEIISDPNQEIKITGLIGSVFQHRQNRNGISLYINGRMVQNRSLSFSLEQAYHDHIPNKKFPIGVINIQVPFDEIDVNIHPAKTEVRLINENQIFSLLQRSVRKTLNSYSLVKRVPVFQNNISLSTQNSDPSEFWPIPKSNDNNLNYFENISSTNDLRGSESSLKEILDSLLVIGQISLTYIVCEGNNGLYLVDQHAAHERILFESILSRNLNEDVEIQRFLDPFVLEVDDFQREFLEENLESITSLGYLVEEFGTNSMILRGVPKIISTKDPVDSFVELINNDSRKFMNMPSSFEKIVATIACHGSVRAGDKLAITQMQDLIDQLKFAENSNNCPHGRPTVLNFDTKTIETYFGRR
tara:strand:- start:41359 stop:43092 length:1734 start_codon:yes stop_codon:yes gene_type:complete